MIDMIVWTVSELSAFELALLQPDRLHVKSTALELTLSRKSTIG